MTVFKTSINRRSFMKSSALAGGGMILGFSWLASCNPSEEQILAMPENWYELNGFLKIGENGLVTIMSPNPEIGQNVKTSMPMIIAEELDVDWNKVIVEQAPLNTELFKRQLAGGSQSIRQGWDSLRMAGATARRMLLETAAEKWEVPVEDLSTDASVVHHKSSGKSISYGALASSAAGRTVPEEVALKEREDYKIIGTPTKNVDGKKIVTGKPLFGLDYKAEGMLIAMIAHPPAFGLGLANADFSKAMSMPGIKDVFQIDTYPSDYKKNWVDVDAFSNLVVVVGESTWQVMQAKKALELEWEEAKMKTEVVNGWGGEEKVNIPAGLENTSDHINKMASIGTKNKKTERKDGNPELAFKNAAKVIESTFTAPFLAHNTMEPMNFFANVSDEKAELVGPIQTPEAMEKSISERLGLPLEKIDIQMTRMGGGFGRRLYGHFVVEAALISQKMKAPVKLVYSREDDMSFGCYRPAYHATYRAAIDKDNNLTAIHVIAGGIPESPLFSSRFPAGAVDNYHAESWTLDSNITVGAWRAPRSNFIAGAEQSFLDEIAEAVGKDPIEFRLDLLKRAETDPVGERNDYDAARYAGVLELLKDKMSDLPEGVSRGISAYYCHNSYVANALDLRMSDGKPVIDKVTCAVDCGIVINPLAATNMVEGGTIDGIGHALFSGLTFKDGVPQEQNFDKYRLIRHREAPKAIDVHFVDNGIRPTGLGEPPFPPILGAVANAMYRATGVRQYDQPFLGERKVVG